MPTFHAKRSPSTAKRFMACPGTLALCASLPEIHQNQSGIAAQLGTATHGLIERCLQENSEPESYRGRLIELVGEEEGVSILRPGAKLPGRDRVFFEVDSAMIDGAEVMTDYVRRRLGAGATLQLESRTNPLPDRDDTSGTADVTIDAWPDLLEVVDYKNGYNVVEHEDNEQTLAYLLGKAIDSDFSHERYRVTIVQPNAPHEDGRVRSFDTNKKDLEIFQARYRKGVERCEVAETEFKDKANWLAHPNGERWAKKHLAAGDHCLFCDAQAVCPARLALAQDDAAIDFFNEPREIELPAHHAAVARILAWAPAMETLIRAADAYAHRSMSAGYAVAGFKLVRGRSTRKLRDDMTEPNLVAAIVKNKYVASAVALYAPPKLLSGPQIEKLVAKPRREEFNDRFLVKPEGALTVAPEDDAREAVECNPAADFAEFA